MILADGYASDEEIAGLDALRDLSHFEDLDACLEEFESAVQDEESFWVMAAAVVRSDAQDLILRRLDEISRMDGYKSTNETLFYDRLKSTWS